MGIARDKLSAQQRGNIAKGLFKVKSIHGKELHGLCPLHKDSNPSFSYNTEKDVYNCLACEASGDLADLWMKINGQTGKEGFKAFCRAAGIESEKGSWPPVLVTPKKKEPAADPPLLSPEPPRESPYLDGIYNQLPPLPDGWSARLSKTRGWSREAITRAGLRMQTLYQDKKGNLCKIRRPERVAIPVKDSNGRVRNMRLYKPGAKSMKIISWGRGYGKSRLFPAKPWMDGMILLCEGEADTLCAISKGFNGITQTSKTKHWKSRDKEVFKARDVVIAYDADQAGVTYGKFAAAALASCARSVRILTWPDWMGRQEDGNWPEKGGQDLTDFFVRHGKIPSDLKQLIDEAQKYDPPGENPGDYMDFFRMGPSGRVSFVPRLLADKLIEEVNIMFEPETGMIYRWTGQHWEKYTREYLEEMATRYLGNAFDQNRVKNAVYGALRLSTLPPGRQINDRPDWICIRNGMFNIRTGELKKHDRNYYATYQIPVMYENPGASCKCRRWLRFLRETVQTPEVIRQVQEFAGLCMTRDVRFGQCLILIGPGSDGKSLFIKILRKLVGPENCSAVSFDDLEDKFMRSSLYGKVLNISTEVGSKALESKYFKAITTGDLISASYKHKDNFEFVPFCKLVFATNKMPRVLDNSDGLFRRILPVRFKRQFFGKNDDKDLEKTLERELSGIFEWAILGLHRLWKQKGFTASEETNHLLMDYQRLNNPVLCFMEDCCLLGEDYEVSKDDLYSTYKQYAKKNGYSQLNRVNFFRELYAAKVNLRQYQAKYPDGSRQRKIKGIQIDAMFEQE